MNEISRTARRAAVLLVMAACAPRPAPAAIRGTDCMPTEGGAMRFVVADPPGITSLGGEAFTASCRLPREAAARLAADAPAVLYVEGIRAPADRGVTVDVYLAGESEPVGSFTLIPAGGGGPTRAPVPLGRTLAAGLRAGSDLSITLRAADPADENAAPAVLGFDRIVVEFT